MTLQCLLLFRVAVPAIHTLMHGVEDSSTETSPLCSLSEAATKQEEPKQSLPVTQTILADMLPAQMEEYSFLAPVTASPPLPLHSGDTWINTSSPIFTPPPQV
ncbi:hypothetical protein [Sabulibacter ruber]|uniref:hypothetical protein n=1 Tax=Sabulibacter ruber TaxID=2811901 RepID=UPI001A96C5C1|nr:hypothetical protein [Sabulibacter ruber]